ncbi:hypothetical protein BDV95DRAFT_311912 [Massariosphaeria phaeospora]|uniref:Uncharacterized protein n=1 Tax=Massariosphaeria phaeospora TaxID=100035 RepID=A0A7C8MDV9_9PLEO|nr:hypothetical protein BDV95DRAFT_311912 [Massariosphaeria phaeospora]
MVGRGRGVGQGAGDVIEGALMASTNGGLRCMMEELQKARPWTAGWPSHGEQVSISNQPSGRPCLPRSDGCPRPGAPMAVSDVVDGRQVLSCHLQGRWPLAAGMALPDAGRRAQLLHCTALHQCGVGRREQNKISTSNDRVGLARCRPASTILSCTSGGERHFCCSAICHQPSAICHLPSAICHLPSAIGHLKRRVSAYLREP